MAGIRNTEPLAALKDQFPTIHAELLAIFARLEAHYRDMCDTEFTIEQGKLWMLQTRVGKRTGRAALRMAVDMTRERAIKLTQEEAVGRITAEHLEQVLHPQFAGSATPVLATGLGASPGAAVGRVYFTADDAQAAAERGEKVILVRSETSPEDVHGMLAAEGILTARGGLVSHAAVVARGWGKPAVVGAEAVRIAGVVVHGGRHRGRRGRLDLDRRHHRDGRARRGPADRGRAPPEFETILGWADEIRAGHLGVRANADNGPDAANARRLGAEGIGLCRTEHMFLAEDRLPIVRRMILASTPGRGGGGPGGAPGGPAGRLRGDPRGHGRPAGHRPPARPAAARVPARHRGAGHQGGHRRADRRGEPPVRAAKAWHEFNPMLGTRGVRLGVIKPGLYAMQVRALMEAALERVAAGGKPDRRDHDPPHRDPRGAGPGPLLGGGAPSPTASGRPGRATDQPEPAPVAGKLEVIIGTMIETPRAALRADEIAEEADFFSFGTNDLTQMTFGFSRDDVEGRMMSAYLEQGLLKRNPFETIDPDGVGELVQLGVERGRATRPDLKIGVCGEHGGDPESIATFARAGLDYVSCSPFRVPIARLAAAQAVLAGLARPSRGRQAKSAKGAAEGAPGRAQAVADPRRPGTADGAGRSRGTVDTHGHPRRGRGPGPGGHRHRRPDRRARRPEAAGPALGRACARSTARRRRRSVSTPRRASTTASAARPRATPSPSCGPSSTSTSSRPSAAWPTGPASPSARTPRSGRDSQRRKVFLDAMEQADRVVPPAPADRRRRRPARDYLRSRGYDGEVVRRFRLGWAPDGWDALCRASG